MRELTLKYFIDLVSNLGTKARADAKMMQDAQAMMNAAITGTNSKFLDYNHLTLLAGKNTAMMQEVITGATSKFTALDRAISQLGHNTSTERQIGYLMRLGQAADQAWNKSERLRKSIAQGVGSVASAVPGAIAGGYAAQRVIDWAVGPFKNLEEAQVGLKVAMLRKGGKVDSNYDAIMKKAVALGMALPGTTKDFTSAAEALVSAGVPPAAVANGALEASSYMGAVMKMDQKGAALTVAKLREAYSLHDDELPAVADEAQRAKWAFGMAPGELLMGAKYSGARLGLLGVKGRQSMSEMMTLQGMANLKGMPGEQFGTEMDMIMTRLAAGPLMLEEAKKGMKAKAQEDLDRLGIKINFFDEKGSLKRVDGSPIKGLMKEMEKFMLIKRALGDEAAVGATGAFFGQEASRLALTLADAGVGGFEKGRAMVADQASLNERIAVASTTLAWKLETLAGTVENVRARIGAQTGEGSKSRIDKSNDWLGGPADKFFTDHPTVGTVGLGAAATAAAVSAWRIGRRFFGPAAVAASEAPAPATGMARLGAATGASLGGLASLFKLMPAIPLAMELFGTSDADLQVLASADRMRQGYRGKGYNDPRLLTLTAPPGEMSVGDQKAARAALAGISGLEVGRLDVNVVVHDERVTATTSVGKPMSLVRINSGNTNPAGY